MENVQQLTRHSRVSILKSMPEAVAEDIILTDEEKRVKLREQRQKEREAARKRAENRTPEERKQITAKKAERDAKKALASLTPKENETVDPRKLAASYDSLKDLEARLTHSTDTKLKENIRQKLQAAEAELRIRGIDVGLPKHEIESIAQMPTSYSVSLINNVAQAALGISIVEADVTSIQSITTADGATTIHVPKGGLTVADTLAIAKEISSNSSLLTEKGVEVIKFGKDLQDLSIFLAGQTSEGKSIFETEEQHQAMADLYNAGIWLERLVNGQRSNENITWEKLEKKANDKAFLDSLDENNYSKKKHLVGILFGKPLGKTGVPTTYQSLRDRFKENILKDPTHDPLFDRDPQALDKAADEKTLEMLSTRGMSIVKRFAPQIAESFSKGKGAKAIARRVQQLEQVVPKVVFEAARGKVAEHAQVSLPPLVEKTLRERYGDGVIPDTRNLFEAARNIVSREKNPQKQLAALNDLVRHYQVPGEVSGNTIAGYQLAKVYDNPNAEIGCAVRAYILTAAIQEAYKDLPENNRPSVVANTLLVSKNDGSVMGHTRLQVVMHTDDGMSQTYTVDPSVVSFMENGVTRVESTELTHQILKSGQKGESVFAPWESKDALSQHQWIGDAFVSQEANMLLNISHGLDKNDQLQMLNMALRDDPNNQMVRLRLAALSEEGSIERRVQIEELQKENPALKDGGRLKNILKTAEVKLGAEVAANIFREASLNALVARFYARLGVNPGIDLRSLAYNPQRLRELRDLQIRLTEELDRLGQAGTANYSNDFATLRELTDRGNPRLGVPPNPNAEIGIAIVKMQEQKRATPDGLWEDFQEVMQELENSRMETGLGTIQGNYSISNDLQRSIEDARAKGTYPPDLIEELQSELQVRSSAHDVVVIARLKGESGANSMAELANKMTIEDYSRVEALPGVALVRRMYEQEQNRLLAKNGGLKSSDFDEIKRRIEVRFRQYANSAGFINFKYNQATDPELHEFEIRRALSVGRNIFVYKNRDAHFISLGDPAVMGGYGIGNMRLDFIVRLFAPGYWSIFRYGLNNPHVKPIIEHLGKDKIDRMLYLQDHDSSIWRVPAFLGAFNALGGEIGYDEMGESNKPTNKLALFMRLYWLGETSVNPDQARDAGIGGESEFLKKNSLESLKAERRRIVKDIITYVPEELASIFHDHPDMQRILNSTNYEQFLTDITFAREECVRQGDYIYQNFYTYLNARSLSTYNELKRFLTPYANDLANPDWIYKKGEERGEKGRLNPLFRKRVYSLADAPFEKIDIINGNPNAILVNAFGGQDMGRELSNLGGASQAFGVLDEFFTHPSMEAIEKMKKKIVAYKGWAQDIIVRDEMFDGLVDYIKEDKALRLLLPGLDVAIGNLIGGRSKAQREQGKWSEAYDTIDLVQLVKTAISKGDISHEKADEIMAMAVNLGPLLQVCRIAPLLQLFVVIAFVSFLKSAINFK